MEREQAFKEQFIATFLAGLAATQYETRSALGEWPMAWPIEDARHLAEDAWKALTKDEQVP